MLKRIQNGYEIEKGVTLNKDQQERFDEIKNYPAGFMEDYNKYILEGSMPSEFDEEGNKRNLRNHPMAHIVDREEKNQIRGRVAEVERATGSGGRDSARGIAQRIDEIEDRISKLEGS